MKVKQKKGISLIVLVITIIVMIILAAAIILSLNGSGVVGKADQARVDSDAATKKEAAAMLLAEYKLAAQSGETDMSANDYVIAGLANQKIETSDVVVTEDETILVGPAAIMVKNNVPIGAKIVGYDLTEKTYETSGKEHSGTKRDTIIEGEKQILKTNTTMEWIYIGVDENGNALITPKMSTKVENLDAAYKIEMGYQGVYLHGVTVLNNACDTLYTTNKGTARSMNINDVNRLLEYQCNCTRYMDKEGKTHETYESLTIGKVGERLNATIGDTKTPEDSNATWEDISKYALCNAYVRYTREEINSRNKQFVFQTGEYWLATRSVWVQFAAPNSDYAIFDLMVVTYEFVHGGSNSYYSFGSGNAFTKAIRPVVELAPDVTVTYDGTTVTLS